MPATPGPRLQMLDDPDSTLPWLTAEQFQSLTEREKDYEYQRFMQMICGYLGFWQSCDLALCRRARACRGYLSEAQFKAGNRSHVHPPCYGTRNGRYDDIQDFARELKRYVNGDPGPFTHDFDNIQYRIGPSWRHSHSVKNR
ncbi:hypothetical protein ACFPM9_13585 [Rhizobium halophytocola]